MPASILDEENGSLELETRNMTEHPVDGAGVTVGLCLLSNSRIDIQNRLTLSESVGHTQIVAMDHRDDPNFDSSAPAIEDESPYPEVRSAVSNTDDPTMPSSTLRSWVVGLIFVVLISGMNQFFFFRYPTVLVTMVCVCFAAIESSTSLC